MRKYSVDTVVARVKIQAATAPCPWCETQHHQSGFVRNLLEPLKDGRVRLLLNAGDHASMQESLKECLEEMGVDFKVTAA